MDASNKTTTRADLKLTDVHPEFGELVVGKKIRDKNGSSPQVRRWWIQGGFPGEKCFEGGEGSQALWKECYEGGNAKEGDTWMGRERDKGEGMICVWSGEYVLNFSRAGL